MPPPSSPASGKPARTASGPHPWSSAAGLVAASVTLGGAALAGGAALDTFSKPGPMVVRALTEASLVAFGAISSSSPRCSWPRRATRSWPAASCPRWAGWAGWALAAVNLAAVPAIDQGNGFLEKVIAGGSAAGGVYSSLSSIAGPAAIAWLLASGIAL